MDTSRAGGERDRELRFDAAWAIVITEGFVSRQRAKSPGVRPYHQPHSSIARWRRLLATRSIRHSSLRRPLGLVEIFETSLISRIGLRSSSSSLTAVPLSCQPRRKSGNIFWKTVSIPTATKPITRIEASRRRNANGKRPCPGLFDFVSSSCCSAALPWIAAR